MAPPLRPPIFGMSANADFSIPLYSSSIGICHIFSPRLSPLASSLSSRPVIRESTDVDGAERHHDGTGQRGGIHMWVRQVASHSDGVGKDQPAFGVRVQYFDGLTGKRCHDVARPLGVAARHVFDRGDDADDLTSRLELRDGLHGADHGGAASHVVLHLLHAIGGLDGNAAGVEGDAFADQGQVVSDAGMLPACISE